MSKRTEYLLEVVTVEWLAERCHEDGDCLIWDGLVSRSGAPVMRERNGSVHVRRLAWAAYGGRSLGPKERMTTCDNPRCLARDHLKPTYVGEILSKMVNRPDVKPRIYQALANLRRKTHAKISLADAREIRASPKTPAELLGEYPISLSMLRKIKRGEAWKEFAASPFSGLGAR